MFELLTMISIAATTIAMATVLARSMRDSGQKRRAQLERRIGAMVDASDFSTRQKNWLFNSAATKMIAYQMTGRYSSLKFYTLNEMAIVILGANIAIPGAIAAFAPSFAMQGLAGMAMLSAIGVIITGVDKLEQNSVLWQDSHELAGLIEDALDELLTDTPEIPVNKQFDQFVAEYRAICIIEREMQRSRVKQSQAVATEKAEDLKSNIAQSREEYRLAYASVQVDPVSAPEIFVPTIGETKVAAWDAAKRLKLELEMNAQAAAAPVTAAPIPAPIPVPAADAIDVGEFIAYATSGAMDDDDEPLSGAFKGQW